MTPFRSALLVLAVAALALSACGKKPGFPDAPEGAAPDQFPKVYPDPKTGAKDSGWGFP